MGSSFIKIRSSEELLPLNSLFFNYTRLHSEITLNPLPTKLDPSSADCVDQRSDSTECAV